eukprot:COSAG04_NODE_6571_length_1302_cov_3.160432_2_plen_74_part_01
MKLGGYGRRQRHVPRLRLVADADETEGRGADVPDAWFTKVKSWMGTFCEKGFVAIEKGGARGHRHVQAPPPPPP